MWNDFLISLGIMGKGMAGIFVVIGILTLLVMLMGRCQSPEGRTKMTKILLVEDDRAIVENLSAVLRTEGFLVRAEEGQEEALRAVEEESFDLLLLDVSLKNGKMDFPLFRCGKSVSDLPVIFSRRLPVTSSVW